MLRCSRFERICASIGHETITIVNGYDGWPGLANVSTPIGSVMVALHVSPVSSHARKDYELRFQNPGQNRPVQSPDGAFPLLVGETGNGILVMVDGSSRIGRLTRFSILFHRQVIDDALRDGWAAYTSNTGERIYAFHPVFFTFALSQVMGFSDKIPEREIISISESVGVECFDIPEVKERVRRSTNTLVRHHSFSKDVRYAYDNKCAMCGINMGVVVGAHIYPASAPGSLDHPVNGLALCQNHHTIFDNHEIWIDPETREIFFHPNILLEADQCTTTRMFIEHTYRFLSKPVNVLLEPRDNMFVKRYEYFREKYNWI